MVSMSEFLSGFSHQGEPVIQQGQIDPSRRREGLDELGTFGLGGSKKKGGAIFNQQSLLFLQQQGYSKEEALQILEGTFGDGEGGAPKYGMHDGQFTPDPSDFVFGGPEIFARLLQSAEMDGGFLSDVAQNAQFAGETAGLMGAKGSADRDRLRAASAANLNPIFAERQNINAGYDLLSQLLGRRGQLGAELEERKFGAQEAFANMLAETDVAEKTFKVNTQTALAGAQMGAEGAIAGGKAAGSGAKAGGLLQGIGSVVGAGILKGI